MFNILAVRKNTKNLYAYFRLSMLLSAIMECSRRDPRAIALIEQMEENDELCVSAYPLNKVISCKKTDGKLKCSIKDDLYLSDRAYIMFKSIELAIPVMHNLLSFTDALNQSRLIVKGDIELGMRLIKVFDIAQVTLATSSRRKKYLKEKPLNSNVQALVRLSTIFRGWL